MTKEQIISDLKIAIQICDEKNHLVAKQFLEDELQRVIEDKPTIDYKRIYLED